MFYKPGNSGTMYGKPIKYGEFRLDGEKWITFICGSETKTVRTKLSALEYINSYYVEGKNNTLDFVKPKPFDLPPWGYEEIASTDLLINYLFKSTVEKKIFINCFGYDYLRAGKIITARDAIDYINKNEVRDWRLEMAICNYILEKEWDNIHLYVNRTIEPYTVKKTEIKKYAIYDAGEMKDINIKTALGEFYPVFKKNIHKDMYRSDGAGYYCRGVTGMSTQKEFGGAMFIFGYRPWPKNWPLTLLEGDRISLVRPALANIPGIVWPFKTNYNYKINGIDCHLEVLKARGGEFFKADFEKFKEKNEMNLELDMKNIISFIYTRKATITNGKAELAIARYFMNADYEKYVFNWFIKYDIFHYYKLKN